MSAEPSNVGDVEIRTETGMPVSGGGSLLSGLQTKSTLLESYSQQRTQAAQSQVGGAKPLTEFEAHMCSVLVPTGGSLVGMVRNESRKSVAALRRNRARISRGQSPVAVGLERLFSRLEREGCHAKAAVMSEYLRGDTGSVDRVSRKRSQPDDDWAEFFVILRLLQESQDLSWETAQLVAQLERTYLVQVVCTEPEYLKVPEQVLRGSVSITAPPAVPADITHMGYAVGLVA